MTSDQITRQIDALQFAQLELQLYLDVHPWDYAAGDQWRQYGKELETLQRRYTETTGNVWPQTQTNDGGTLAWVTSPWPWDNQQ
ncbi:MAG: spore coat protein CotJB [Firmicutes bacterium]|nr:spore coat protein CotJB [Bacillota bacterium]